MLGKLTNHPVHLVDQEAQLLPTALIPFCEFHGEFKGVKIESFDVPVCNFFKDKILHDQLCYEVDLNVFRQEESITPKFIFALYIDYNEDREMFLRESANSEIDHYIKVETIGNNKIFYTV